MVHSRVLHTHPDRICDTLGVSKCQACVLCPCGELSDYGDLQDTKHVSREEQLAIFLRLARTGLGQREARECFQRLPETVSMYVNLLLPCTFGAYIDFVSIFRRILEMLISPKTLVLSPLCQASQGHAHST